MDNQNLIKLFTHKDEKVNFSVVMVLSSTSYNKWIGWARCFRDEEKN